MKAALYRKYGSPDVLELTDLPRPVPDAGQVLVRVKASSVNPADWYNMIGLGLARPGSGWLRPKDGRVGIDYAGVVEAVGEAVTRFQPGDEVFGARNGACAEYVTVRADRGIVLKPANVTFEQAAGVAVAGLTALQGLRDYGQLKAGQRVLINGAAGGVGTFSVQVAKCLGAEVTAVCSTRNVDMVRSLGADHVVDYTREDFTRSGRRYDLLFDVAGGRSFADCRRVLAPNAALVIVGGPKGNRLIGPLSHLIRIRLGALGASQKVTFFISKTDQKDLEVLGEMLGSGRLVSVVDRTYPLTEIQAAMRYLGTRHARAKVVVTV
jgi:NADPH:quinone reductase-like Zn-dependent oxidoreductase